MFDIKDSVDFYGLMIENYDDFVENSGSSRHAINCAISALHLAEWIWGDWLKTDYETWKKLNGVRSKETFVTWLKVNMKWFNTVKDIANGSKHFDSRLVNTKSSGAYVEDGYVEEGYQARYLEVQIDGNWIEAIIVLEEMIMFWTDFFADYRPNVILPKPRNPFTYMPD